MTHVLFTDFRSLIDRMADICTEYEEGNIPRSEAESLLTECHQKLQEIDPTFPVQDVQSTLDGVFAQYDGDDDSPIE